MKLHDDWGRGRADVLTPGLCDWCAAVVCDDPGYDVCTPTEWDNE